MANIIEFPLDLIAVNVILQRARNWCASVDAAPSSPAVAVPDLSFARRRLLQSSSSPSGWPTASFLLNSLCRSAWWIAQRLESHCRLQTFWNRLGLLETPYACVYWDLEWMRTSARITVIICANGMCVSCNMRTGFTSGLVREGRRHYVCFEMWACAFVAIANVKVVIGGFWVWLKPLLWSCSEHTGQCCHYKFLQPGCCQYEHMGVVHMSTCDILTT